MSWSKRHHTETAQIETARPKNTCDRIDQTEKSRTLSKQLHLQNARKQHG